MSFGRGRGVLAVAVACVLAGAPSLPLHAQTGAAEWSLDEYQRLSAEMEAADEDRVLATRGSTPWREATLAAIDARRALVAYIGGAVRNGTMPSELRNSAAAARLVLIQNIVVLHTDLGNCDQAATAVRLLDDAAGSANAEVERARTIALDSVAACEPVDEAATVAGPDEVVVPEGSGEASLAEATGSDDPAGTGAEPAPLEPGDELVAEPPPVRSGRSQRIAGLSLLGVGAGMAVGGLAWDAANAAGPRADFTAERNRCPDCDAALLDELASDINAARAPIGVLLFGGIAVAGVGTAVWLTAPGERAEVALVPSLGGAHALVRFGGGARH